SPRLRQAKNLLDSAYGAAMESNHPTGGLLRPAGFEEHLVQSCRGGFCRRFAAKAPAGRWFGRWCDVSGGADVVASGADRSPRRLRSRESAMASGARTSFSAFRVAVGTKR